MSGFDPQEDLEAAAVEELERACTLGWAQLRRHTPWGDSYEGFTPAGVEVVFERGYLWNDKPDGEILVEVVVRHVDASHSVTLNRLLRP